MVVVVVGSRQSRQLGWLRETEDGVKHMPLVCVFQLSQDHDVTGTAIIPRTTTDFAAACSHGNRPRGDIWLFGASRVVGAAAALAVPYPPSFSEAFFTPVEQLHHAVAVPRIGREEAIAL